MKKSDATDKDGLERIVQAIDDANGNGTLASFGPLYLDDMAEDAAKLRRFVNATRKVIGELLRKCKEREHATIDALIVQALQQKQRCGRCGGTGRTKAPRPVSNPTCVACKGSGQESGPLPEPP